MVTYDAVKGIVNYCSEEVRRQGRGPIQVGNMVEAWMLALQERARGSDLSLELIKKFGHLIEPEFNHVDKWRGVNVMVGNSVKPTVNDVPVMMERWLEFIVPNAAPELVYKSFEEIHPFRDGNGRTGKIIYNWLSGSLLNPQWPPNFWGGSNP